MQRGQYTQVNAERFVLKIRSAGNSVFQEADTSAVSYLNTLQAFAYVIPLFKWQEVKQLAEVHSTAQHSCLEI